MEFDRMWTNIWSKNTISSGFLNVRMDKGGRGGKGQAGGDTQRLKEGGGTKKQREVDNSHVRASVEVQLEVQLELHQRKIRSQVSFLSQLIKI